MVLARGPHGYAQLARAISQAQLAGAKGDPRITVAALGELARAVTPAPWVVLTGTARGVVPQALVDEGPAAARRELERLVETFGRDQVLVEIWDHGHPLDSARNDELVKVAAALGVPTVATNAGHYPSLIHT